MIEGIIGAIIGSAITGIITIICELVKTKHQDKKDNAAYQRDLLEKRPELKIVGYKNYLECAGLGIHQKTDADVFVAKFENAETFDNYVDVIYNLEHFDRKKWCCIIYTFVNAGKTDISNFDIMVNFKQTCCLFNSKSAKEFAKEKMLPYSCCIDKKVRVGESFSLKVCYYNDLIVSSMLSASMSIGMVDSNNHFWEQPLFAPDEKIYDSYPVDGRKYFTDIKTDDAEECFRKPYLW